MSEIGQENEPTKYKFIWTPAPRDVPELEFKEMTIEELENDRINKSTK